MNSQRPLPLYPNPPFSSKETQIEPASTDEYSDFPPIRERKSTPDRFPSASNCRPRRSPIAHRHSERRSSPSEEPGPSQLRRHPPNTGLGHRNRLNTIANSASVAQAQSIHKPSLKRDAEVLDGPEERPLKRKRMALTSEDNIIVDKDWLKHEMSDMKERIKEIAEHLGGDTYYRLEELLQYVRELS